MFQTLVRKATSAYRPLPAHQSGEPGVKYAGKMVNETQLNCFYISPGDHTSPTNGFAP
ncbi:PREDICTED: voltage-dependent L-type calcium channel subunit alpha-1C [Thamnophis sirtalis]|uniref:Voltage-dependent L-type calcium channel subunit alpha-1C n=1 Tax=Thamnophis sirtalis TaxID=35019 RepID=A0A6I9XAL5_9SAUR|nr:PREDICTED: voltage-dependent L-type calcium channel subunit alpha-1C [Thamnophis sirtalis]